MNKYAVRWSQLQYQTVWLDLLAESAKLAIIVATFWWLLVALFPTR